MANGLPWVGASGKKPDAAAQYTPPGGYPGPDAQSVKGNATTGDAFVHESLRKDDAQRRAEARM